MKKSVKWIAPVIALALLSGCGKTGDNASGSAATGNAAQAVAAPAGSDWVSTVVKTPEFGYRMGNPDAAVKLIEYAAFSCPHCARFAQESEDGLKAMVAKGTVSYELRPFLIHPQDLPATLLVGCNGPAPFFTIAHQLFSRQETWLANSSTLTEGMVSSWSAQGEHVYAAQMGAHLGLPAFVAPLGVGESKAMACMSDKAAIGGLRESAKIAETQFQVSSTPTFIVNGAKADINGTWAELEQRLRAAGA